MNQYLLDTCALIWISGGDPISANAESVLRKAEDDGESILISPMSAWELGMLLSKNRLKSSLSAQGWLDRVLDLPHVNYCELSPEVLIASSFLPGSPPNDPVDRIIIATARLNGLTIVTRDRLILDYAENGHAKALKC